MTKVLMRSVCVAALLAASGTLGASAQQTIAPVSATPVPGPMPAVLQNYAPVTTERLKKPEDGNWLMFRRTYDGWGYSPLGEITRENVSRLQPVWSFATGQVEGHQAPPIVNNGVMFVATPGNQLLALEAKTGNLLWRYKRPFPEDMTPLHPTNRGVALYGDKVLFAAAEAILVALDAKTGKEVWTATVDDYRRATTCRCRRSSPTARCCSVHRAANWGCAGSSLRSTLRRASRSGKPTRYRRRASLAARPGRRAATTISAAAPRSGLPAPTIPRPISASGGRAMAAPGSATSGPGTISTPPRWLLST